MSFLEINTFKIPVYAKAAITFSRKEIGRRFQSSQNLAKKHVRKSLKDLSFSTPAITQIDADVLTHLIHGEGHVFNFDGDFVAGSSLRPSNYTAAISHNGGLNGGSLVVLNSSFAEFDAQLSIAKGYFIMTRKFITSSSTWEQWAISSNGDVWINGVKGANVAVTNTIKVVAGKVQLYATDDLGVLTTQAHYDELIILPWLPTDDMITAWTTQQNPFSAFPFLNLSGDGGTFKAIGQVTKKAYTEKSGYTSLDIAIIESV